jgi:hypothetical protein
MALKSLRCRLGCSDLFCAAIYLALTLVGIVATIANEKIVTFDQEATDVCSMCAMELVEVVKATDEPHAETRDRCYRCPLDSIEKINFVVGQSVTDDIKISVVLTREIEHSAFDVAPFWFRLDAILIPFLKDRFGSLFWYNAYQYNMGYQVQRWRPTGVVERDLCLHRDTVRHMASDRHSGNTHPWTISNTQLFGGRFVQTVGDGRVNTEQKESTHFGQKFDLPQLAKKIAL